MVVGLRARREAKVHEVGDGRLPLAAVERTHSELAKVSLYMLWGTGKTHRLSNGIVFGLPKALRGLVLLAGLLGVAWRGRGARRRPRSETAAPASSLSVAVASRDGTGLGLGG